MITVTNNGPSNATNVVVTDALPAGLTYVSDDCGASNVPPWTWNVGALAASASSSCNLTVTVTQPGTITNSATVTSDQGDPVTANNTGSADVTGQQSVLEIPTLGAASMALLLLLLGGLGVALLRRRHAGPNAG
jgi:hypothetical protein